MAHVRTQVREKVKALIADAVGWRVYSDMTEIFTAKSYPAVFIQAGTEIVDRLTLGKVYLQERECDIEVIIASQASNAQDSLESKLLLIEKAIAENQTLNNSVQSVDVVNVSFDASNDSGVSKVSVISISLSVTYRTMNNDLETFV